MTTLADLDAMASTKPWGAKLPTKGLVPPRCPECGRQGRILEAWANVRHKAVLNCVCEGCMGRAVDYHWNHWNGCPSDYRVQVTLDRWLS